MNDCYLIPLGQDIAKINRTVDHAAEKNRSYDVRPQSGELVRARRDLHCYRGSPVEHGTVLAGSVFRIYSVSNAGFAGITFYAVLEDGWQINGTLTGALDRMGGER